MKAKLVSAATVVLAVSTVAFQAGAGGAGSATRGLCRPGAAKALAGMARLTDKQARKMTGATIVRQISPGQGVTMDYRRERVTIETDPKTGRIVRAFCG
jgi:hypothetical protein